MTEYTIPVYSDQTLGQEAAKIIRSILAESFPEHTITFTSYKVWDKKVLVFGREPEGEHRDVEFIKTYSIAQMMTKANAATVLTAAIRQFISEPVVPPFQRPLGYPGLNELQEYVDFAKPVAIDIETDGNFAEGDTPEDVGIISIAFYQEGRAPIVIHGRWENDRTNAFTWFGWIPELINKFEYTIWHNGKFDIRVIENLCGKKINAPSFDTMLAHHVLNQAAGDHKLKHLAQRYLGAPEWEQDLKKYLKRGGHYELIPTHKLVEYNGWDVYWTFELWKFLKPQIESDETYESAFLLEMSFANVALEIEKYGIPLDLDYVNSYRLDLETQIRMLEETMRNITDEPQFNPRSPNQIKAWLEDAGVVVASTDVDSITSLANDPKLSANVRTFCEKLLAHRLASKKLGTYVNGWSARARNGRVHPTFLIHGTSTGRLSSTNPNAQNVPRDKEVRKLVAAHD